MTKAIPLTKGQIAVVDNGDYDLLSAYSWYAKYNKSTDSYYAITTQYGGGSKKTVPMARLILGAKVGEIIDHINHDTLDNTRANLRVVSCSENAWNRKAKQGTAARLKWVSKYRGAWRSVIIVNGTTHALGYYDDPRLAAIAYNQAAIKYFGEFAYLNQVDGNHTDQPALAAAGLTKEQGE